MPQRPSDPQVPFGPQAVRPAQVVAGDVLSWLLDQSHELAPADLVDALGRAFMQVGAVSSRLFLSDHDQMSLNPLDAVADGDGDATSFRIDGTVAGRAFSLETTCAVPVGDGVRLWVPVLNGTARLGVVAVDFSNAPDAALIRRVETVAALAAQLIETKDSYTDLIELGRRGREMSLAAELQRRNLPPVALVTPYAVVSGILEPAYDVAGDTFDYALNADALHVAVIDSVGHDLGSSVISHLVHGSLRNSRRNGHDLPDTYARADQAVTSVFRELTFATAAFGRLDLASGVFRWVSAGHPPPLVVRGRKAVHEAAAVPSLPIGLGGPPATVNEVALDPGDMVLLYTDGVVEGGARGSERFGLARLIDLLARNLLAELPPAETLRRLARAVLDHSAHELRDDLTMVLVEYRGPTG